MLIILVLWIIGLLSSIMILFVASKKRIFDSKVRHPIYVTSGAGTVGAYASFMNSGKGDILEPIIVLAVYALTYGYCWGMKLKSEDSDTLASTVILIWLGFSLLGLSVGNVVFANLTF